MEFGKEPIFVVVDLRQLSAERILACKAHPRPQGSSRLCGVEPPGASFGQLLPTTSRLIKTKS
jgi:hypothetical protein